jgi:hypothetical protein
LYFKLGQLLIVVIVIETLMLVLSFLLQSYDYYSTGVQPFFGKGPQPFLMDGSRAARDKIA